MSNNALNRDDGAHLPQERIISFAEDVVAHGYIAYIRSHVVTSDHH
jgi:hypothetical protein